MLVLADMPGAEFKREVIEKIIVYLWNICELISDLYLRHLVTVNADNYFHEDNKVS